ncbi:MAG: hypothetical protein MJE68_04975, partial [Proteobacteria bacterium]|nr:hypothetical protein [Pseudomonadota bacterium]
MKSSVTVVIVATKLLFNLQTLQAANERYEAELHQKDEEIRQKKAQLEQVQVNILYQNLTMNIIYLVYDSRVFMCM